MTTYNTTRWFSLLILPLFLGLVGCSESSDTLVASNPTDVPSHVFTIQSAQQQTNPVQVVGTFRASGLIEDTGVYQEDLSSTEPVGQLASVSGTKTLEGEKGTIEIEFYAGFVATTQNTVQALGGFHIIRGTGDYATLRGDGEIDMELNKYASATQIASSLRGKAHFAE